MVNIKKAAVVGVGMVGASIAFSLVQQGLFDELVLIDVNKEKAVGEAMDLSHGLPYCKRDMKVHAGDYEDVFDAGIIIITAGLAQKPGQTRLDLIKMNARIMKGIIEEIKRVKAEGLLLIVSNPVDVLTDYAYRISGLPKNRVFGSGTALDTARLKYLISRHLSVDTSNVHTVILGEHGDSELCAWSFTNIAGIPVNDFCEMRGFHDHEEGMKKLHEEVKDSAYEIIKRKGSTYYGVAMAVSHIVEAIVNDQKQILPLSVELTGQYGISGLALSIPTIVGRNGAEQVLESPLSKEEKEALVASSKTLKEVLDSIE
jgi:L-lactate dehydrogenase